MTSSVVDHFVKKKIYTWYSVIIYTDDYEVQVTHSNRTGEFGVDAAGKLGFR